MERENRGHMKPSPWEQGLSYERALRSGLYPSIRKLAAALGVDQSNANKAMALAQLPAEVIHAFRSPLVIQLRWGTALRNAINKDSDLVIRKAQELAMVDPKLPPIQVLKELVASTQVKTDTHTVGEVPEPHLTMRLMGSGGKEVGSVKQEGIRTKLLIKIPLSQERQRELSEIVAKFLNATVG